MKFSPAIQSLLCLFLVSLCCFGTQRNKPSLPKPNILLILVDDLGYGDLSSYGSKDIRTPVIDQLIVSGMLFNHFYANSPVCSPTRASLMTGRYPDLVGVPGVIRMDPRDNWGRLVDNIPLLPQVLKKAGYQTALVGKWHLGLHSPDLPNERGFDHFHGFTGDMMDDYYTHLRFGENFLRLNNKPLEASGHATDLFSQWAIDYLNSRKNNKKPFFLYLAYTAPHVPVQPPQEWLEKVKQREPGISENRAKLAALIEHLDDQIGKVLAALQANGQAHNTLIMFTSDNGGQLSAGASSGLLRGGKEDMYEGGLRVPFCAVWPGKINANSQSNALATTMDLMPTICAASGISAPAGIDGVSILPTLMGQAQSLEDRPLVWVRREGNQGYQGRDYYAVRQGDWKLVQNSPFRPYQLYNLAADPQEQNDLATENKTKRWELSQLLMMHLQKAGAVPWQRAGK